MFGNIYQGRKVFITGHGGFKGGWLALWLKKLGAEVYGYSLLPDSDERFYDIVGLGKLIDKNIIADICDKQQLEKAFTDFRPDIVFHLAAQPLVRLSYDNPLLTYETNVIGTLNVLQTAKNCPSVKAFINITSDKCYENKENGQAYCESDAFGGYDIYSSSKACSEILSASFRRSFLSEGKPFALATARAGNVIGGGDWAADRLIPDCIRALAKKEPLILRCPQAVRPWQLVLEPLAGYLRLGQKLLGKGAEFAEGFNFGPSPDNCLTVKEIAQKIIDVWGEGTLIEKECPDKHEATLLHLNNEKSRKKLGIAPILTTDEALLQTAEWYKAFYIGNTDMKQFSIRQIDAFEQLAKQKQSAWSE